MGRASNVELGVEYPQGFSVAFLNAAVKQGVYFIIVL
jgi:hypothetical protein